MAGDHPGDESSPQVLLVSSGERTLMALSYDVPLDVLCWIRNWRAGGYEALVPATRSAGAKTPVALLDLAVKLKQEAPGRTAAQVAEVISAAEGSGHRKTPLEGTMDHHLPRRADAGFDRSRGGTV